MLIIVGGRTLDSLYMGPALGQLARFPNVMIVPVCSRSQSLPPAIMRGRPTDVLPVMHPSDVIYACGAAAMIESVKAAASRAGALCYADPFLPATSDTSADSVLTRAIGWLQLPASQSKRPGTPARTASTDAKRVLTEPALRQSVGP
jgi:3-phenylpropionate/trans-cinnamate dioxygenase ferredoxin reductase subunit